jgi:hypothetical protein
MQIFRIHSRKLSSGNLIHASFNHIPLFPRKTFMRHHAIQFPELTLCCKDMFEPLENLTIVCKLAGVDALLMIAAELLFASALGSFTISSGALNGCLSATKREQFGFKFIA